MTWPQVALCAVVLAFLLGALALGGEQALTDCVIGVLALILMLILLL